MSDLLVLPFENTLRLWSPLRQFQYKPKLSFIFWSTLCPRKKSWRARIILRWNPLQRRRREKAHGGRCSLRTFVLPSPQPPNHQPTGKAVRNRSNYPVNRKTCKVSNLLKPFEVSNHLLVFHSCSFIRILGGMDFLLLFALHFLFARKSFADLIFFCPSPLPSASSSKWSAP